MSIEKRVEKLEKSGGGKDPYVCFVVYDGDPELTKAQKEAAIADYKTRNPDWKDRYMIVIYPEDVQFLNKE